MPDDRAGTRAYGKRCYDLKVAGCAAVTLEILTRDDAERLAPAFAAMAPWSGYGMSSAGLAAFLGNTEAGCGRFAIRVDGELSGAVVVREPWLLGPYLHFIGTLPTRQGRGLGSAVLDWMAVEAPRSARNIWLCVTATNQPARAFYARRGFIEAAALPDLVANGTDEILMRRRLPTA